MMVEIEGLEELSTLLTEIAPTAAKRYLSKVAEPAAEVVIASMKQTVPVDIGILEEGFGWQKKWLNDGDETTMEITIGPLKPYFWGSLQEFGTQDVSGTGKKSGKHFHHASQPAQHWMSRAWEACKEDCLSVFVQGVNDLLQKLRRGDAS